MGGNSSHTHRSASHLSTCFCLPCELESSLYARTSPENCLLGSLAQYFEISHLLGQVDSNELKKQRAQLYEHPISN